MVQLIWNVNLTLGRSICYKKKNRYNKIYGKEIQTVLHENEALEKSCLQAEKEVDQTEYKDNRRKKKKMYPIKKNNLHTEGTIKLKQN